MRFLPTILAAVLLIAALLLFSGCYTLKQGFSLLGYLGKAIPLETLPAKADEYTVEDAEKNKVFVERVRDIRQFAMTTLGLAESANYTKYVEIDRNYLATVVSACAKDSFTKYEWWFPIVGTVPYKGFFNPEDAKKEAAALQKKDLDVWVRSVDAFSTLGWFSDPLYSFMRDYSVDRLADLIIHELVHATVFLKGHAQFNEELAAFIGEEGARLYIEERYGTESDEYKVMLAGKSDSAAFIAFIQALIAQLDAVYASTLSSEEKLEQKAQMITAAQKRFTADYDTLFLSANYKGFADIKINNAYLQLYQLYYDGGAYYKELYQAHGSDLPLFIRAIKRLDNSGAPRLQLEQALSSVLSEK
ncbi:aminopeptidase [Breznakiellaceae bacterium SP9]